MLPQEVGRFVAADDYDATARSMRDLAKEADPAAFIRLAEALGYSGCKELGAVFAEARLAATLQYVSDKS